MCVLLILNMFRFLYGDFFILFIYLIPAQVTSYVCHVGGKCVGDMFALIVSGL